MTLAVERAAAAAMFRRISLRIGIRKRFVEEGVFGRSLPEQGRLKLLRLDLGIDGIVVAAQDGFLLFSLLEGR